MFPKKPHLLLIVLVTAAAWVAPANTGLAGPHNHRRYPTGSSPTYSNATPHGGFSSSNSYYSGRSRIADVPPPPAPIKPVPFSPVPTKPAPGK